MAAFVVFVWSICCRFPPLWPMENSVKLSYAPPCAGNTPASRLRRSASRCFWRLEGNINVFDIALFSPLHFGCRNFYVSAANRFDARHVFSIVGIATYWPFSYCWCLASSCPSSKRNRGPGVQTQHRLLMIWRYPLPRHSHSRETTWSTIYIRPLYLPSDFCAFS